MTVTTTFLCLFSQLMMYGNTKRKGNLHLQKFIMFNTIDNFVFHGAIIYGTNISYLLMSRTNGTSGWKVIFVNVFST